ncbi:hypothetical protein [Formosa sp. PL04]|uniref:hypothetical protein n=1 Tax=Formosa sp. PL04 TaxID=3081755 RepID=UPI002980CDAD|nr:hypothetical protein [Formosa sp. PL04]MDW5290267.1 hypothetical protein [Formosa sp. PL04]
MTVFRTIVLSGVFSMLCYRTAEHLKTECSKGNAFKKIANQLTLALNTVVDTSVLNPNIRLQIHSSLGGHLPMIYAYFYTTQVLVPFNRF